MTIIKKTARLANKYDIHGASNETLVFAIICRDGLNISSQTLEDGRSCVLKDKDGTPYLGTGKTLLTAIISALWEYQK